MRAILEQPRSERQVADALHLQLGQTRAWLQRAVEEGLVSLTRQRRKLYTLSGRETHQLKLP
jgi:hypothetical protein